MNTGNTANASSRRKLDRVTMACDICHQRSRKCVPSAEEDGRCAGCVKRGATCTYNREKKKRGPQRRNRPELTRTDSWSKFTDTAVLLDLLAIYDDVMGPIHPFFHVPTTIQSINDGRYLTDRGFHCSLMACCALASAKIRDACMLRLPAPSLPAEYTPEYFFDRAIQQLPDLTSSNIDFQHLRACLVLSHAAAQNGHQSVARRLACEFHSLSDLYGLHDEGNWPPGLSEEEKEEHRRVFWGMYQYEVTFGVINGSIVRNGLEWATVNYASLLPDERPGPESTVPNTNWTIGWNFANDGYRLMEQELKRIHSLRTASRKVHLLPRPARASLDQEDYLGICFNRFQQLPDEVRILRPPCEDAQQNRLRFQAVNASIIVQTLSLVSVAADAEIRGFDEQKCCRVALATLRTLKEIPKQFLRAFGPQIFNHVGGILSLMSALMQHFTSWSTLSLIRQVFVDLAALLAPLEVGLAPLAFSTGLASARLTEQVQIIDRSMSASVQDLLHAQTQNEPWLPLYHHFEEGLSLGNTLPHQENGSNENIPLPLQAPQSIPISAILHVQPSLNEDIPPLNFDNLSNGSPRVPPDNRPIPPDLHDELFADWPTNWEWNLFDTVNSSNPSS